MIVGFVITDFKGNEKAAIEYIKKVCILDDPSMAENIVNAGEGINIFSSGIDVEELAEQPFSTDLIEVPEDKYLLVSTVNFNVELLYNDRVIKLSPTEFIEISKEEVPQFLGYYDQKLVKFIPEFTYGKDWILSEGTWNDDSIWVDSEIWRDQNG